MERTYLTPAELKLLLEELNLADVNDQLILLMAKTGIRYTEALAITPGDFDFKKGLLGINKTWKNGGFHPVKDTTSVRIIEIDRELEEHFNRLLLDKPSDMPIFEQDKISTTSDRLKKHCKSAKIPIVSVHSLRHTFNQPCY